MEDKSINHFLNQVDEIGELVKNLTNSSDSEAIARADAYIKKQAANSSGNDKDRGFSSSSINKYTNNSNSMTQEGFMAAMEKDARERHEKRKQSEKKAQEIKEQGNLKFKDGDYKSAYKYYTEALTYAKMIDIYTNRAQAQIKLEQYKEALIDCDWALKISDKCVKAYVHRGRAFLALKQYDDAEESFKRISLVDPSKASAAETYINEVEICRCRDTREKLAADLRQSGEVKSMLKVMEKLFKRKEPAIYYCGALQVAISLLKTDSKNIVIFVEKKGLKLISHHPFISKCFSVSPRNLSPHETDLCTLALTSVVLCLKENEANQSEFLSVENLGCKLLRILESQCSRARLLKESVVLVLKMLAEQKFSRKSLLNTFDNEGLSNALISALSMKYSYAGHVIDVLGNLKQAKNFQKTLLTQTSEIDNQLTKAFKLFFADFSDKHHVFLLRILRLFSGLIVGQHDIEISTELVDCSIECLMRCTDHEELGRHTIILLDLLVSHSTAKDYVLRNIFTEKAKNCLERFLIEDELTVLKSCLKILTLASEKKQYLKQVATKKVITTLLTLMTNVDENVLGNAALCMGRLVEEPIFTDVLRDDGTDIIKTLLVCARDSHQKQVQQNVAILISKMCAIDPRYRERLRELDGIGILHDVASKMKNL